MRRLALLFAILPPADGTPTETLTRMNAPPLLKNLAACLLVLALGIATAAEVDSFTHRHPLKDSAPFLDQVVNVWLEEAVIEANRPSLLSGLVENGNPGCDEARLMDALKSRLAGYLIGQLEDFVDQSTWLDTIHTTFEESIYRDFDFAESPTVVLTRRLAVLLRLGTVYLGSDKLGHFFTEGHTYFEHYLEKDEQSALDYGELMESSFYGELTTGIFSYADLVANLNGLRFWNAILARKPDPIVNTATVKPYIGCRAGKWHRLREFHWSDYVDPAWDEALNCNVYADEILLEKVSRRIAQATDGNRCPLAKADRAMLERKYGELLPLLFNRSGPRAAHAFDSILRKYWDEILQEL